jgi:hypothetical protein
MSGPVIERGEARKARIRAAAFDATVNWRARFEEARCLGIESIDGRDCYKIVLTPVEGLPETQYYDTESSLLVRIDMSQPSSCGPPIPIEMALSDYRPVDGLLIAHRVEETLEACGTKRGMVFVTEKIEHNVALSADRFDPPPAIREALRSRKKDARIPW